MIELPFNIPKSLQSFVEMFDKDPEKGIEKLKKQVQKRDPDAVGHFLLAWFYHLQDDKTKAIREAMKAKTFAPGSPLMEHLHFFLLHPESFSAAVPSGKYSSEKKFLEGQRSSPVLDLDRLIEMLEAVESQRIQIPIGEDTNTEDLSAQANQVEDIVSETLAKIHVQQGNKKAAIKMYEQLSTINKEKAEEYQKTILKLKKGLN